MKKLKLIEQTKKNYVVEVPERLRDVATPTKVKIRVIDGEYQYRKGCMSSFTSDELRAIADELDNLNKINNFVKIK